MWRNYFAFGDSVTAGVGDPVDGMETRGWADWVAESFASLHPAFSYTNLGWGGCTTADILRGQLPEILNAGPDLVSITVGANDTRSPNWRVESFTRDFKSILQPFADLNTTIITMAYPDVRPAIGHGQHGIPTDWKLYFRRMKALNDVIRRVSERFNTCLLDFESFTPVCGLENMSQDRVHPNALGHKHAAEAVLQILVERTNLPL